MEARWGSLGCWVGLEVLIEGPLVHGEGLNDGNGLRCLVRGQAMAQAPGGGVVCVCMSAAASVVAVYDSAV